MTVRSSKLGKESEKRKLWDPSVGRSVIVPVL